MNSQFGMLMIILYILYVIEFHFAYDFIIIDESRLKRKTEDFLNHAIDNYNEYEVFWEFLQINVKVLSIEWNTLKNASDE